jgi:triacylglycerol esterase/lipase EstA (alpha/beta hydrolase family)
MLKICTLLLCISITYSKQTVYCLHGFLRSKLAMEALATNLRLQKFTVVNWDYPSRSQTIDEHAEELLLKLQNTAIESPGEPISFVTHSMGGLIVRRALNLPGCPYEAQNGRAVLIAPPNQGSTFARLMAESKTMNTILGNNAGRELMEAENFDYLGQFPSQMEILVIAGKLGWNPSIGRPNDGKVTVEETRLSTPHQHLTVLAGHSWITYSPRVVKETRKFLKPKQ